MFKNECIYILIFCLPGTYHRENEAPNLCSILLHSDADPCQLEQRKLLI